MFCVQGSLKTRHFLGNNIGLKGIRYWGQGMVWGIDVLAACLSKEGV
jgi:hypothetical protein